MPRFRQQDAPFYKAISNPKFQFPLNQDTLAAMRPDKPEKAMDVLAKAYVAKRINRTQLATIIKAWGYCDPCTITILVAGTVTEGEYRTEARACTDALCAVSTDHEKTAKIVIENLGNDHRSAIEVLSTLTEHSPAILEFYKDCLKVDDVWTQKEALDALGTMKPKPEGVIELVEPFLKSGHLETKIAAAKTRYLLTDNMKQFDQFLSELLNDHSQHHDEWDAMRNSLCAIEAIGDLEQKGRPFVKTIAALRKEFEWDHEDKFCDALKNIGGNEAAKILKEMSRSKDWKLKTLATRALEELGNQKQNSDDSDK